MIFEHDSFWFVIIYLAGLCFLGAVIFIGASIVFGADLYIENYKNCIKSGLPPKICDFIYPPLKLQAVNWTGLVPFP